MTFTYLALVCLHAPAVTEQAPSTDHVWFASAQVGAGARGDDAVALVRPRLGTEGERYRVILSAPLTWRLLDRPHAEGGEQLIDWTDAASFAGLIETIEWRSSGGRVRARAGTLVQESLGHAVLVDKLSASHDPRVFRTGARADLSFRHLQGTALVDSFIRPHVVAASATAAPLAIAGLDDDARLRVIGEAALDLRAPHFDGKAPLAGFDVNISFGLFRSRTLAFELYAAGVALTKRALGAHAGAQLEWRGRGNDSFVFRLETVASGEGYSPGYFDEAYSVERFAVPERGWLPKAEQRLPSAVGLRGSLDAAFGPARFGFAATLADPRRPGSLALYVRVARPRWSLAAALSQRELSEGRDLVSIGPASHASLDGSVNLVGGLFAFSQLRHGFRRPPHGELEPVFDWLVGLGVGAQTEQTPGA